MEVNNVESTTDAVNGIYEELVSLYGPFMELGDLALVLRRNRNGIRYAVSQAEALNESTDKEQGSVKEWAQRLASCKTRVGKKIMFRTRVVADLLESGVL